MRCRRDRLGRQRHSFGDGCIVTSRGGFLCFLQVSLTSVFLLDGLPAKTLALSSAVEAACSVCRLSGTLMP